MRESKELKSALLLLLAAVIWGTAFVAQQVGMEHIGPFTFTFLRNMVGTIVLLPIAFLSKEKSKNRKTLFLSGILSGIALGVASCLQQYGMLFTSVGKAGFLTALYIIIVPILGLFVRKKPSPRIWLATGMALLGIYLLCISEQFTINRGDVFEILCAVAFAIQILIISRFTHKINAYQFACIQFFTAGIVAAIPMIFTEPILLSGVLAAWFPLLYTGIFSSGIAYTLQIIGERNLNPSVAALIMSLESCISALAGWLLLSQPLSLKELTGCAIMFAAILLTQLPHKNKQN